MADPWQLALLRRSVKEWNAWRLAYPQLKVNLSRADLSGADLSGAYLHRHLSGADLSGANLNGANLRGAELRGADLGGAHLRGADLGGAELDDAHLSGADLSGAKSDAPPHKSSSLGSTSPSLGETIITDLTSREETAIANFITIATGLAACLGVFHHVAKQWSEKDGTDTASSLGSSSQTSETDIVAIRLRMTHGNDPEFEEWLTDPARLKHYIDVFNQPSSSVQPLYAIFVQRNGKAYKVDVSKGAQNNLALEELLSYLNIDETDKDRAKRKGASWRTHFIFYRTVTDNPIPTNHEYWGTIYDLNITYEELIEFLVQKKHLLLPLDPPLRYTLTFKGIVDDKCYFGPSILREGQSVSVITHNVHLVGSSNHPISYFECNISIEMETPPPPKEK